MSILIDGAAETVSYTGSGGAMANSALAVKIAQALDGRMYWAMIAAGNPPLDQLAELCRIPYAALTPIRPVLYSFPKPPVAAGGLSIPVVMHNYRRRRAA